MHSSDVYKLHYICIEEPTRRQIISICIMSTLTCIIALFNSCVKVHWIDDLTDSRFVANFIWRAYASSTKKSFDGINHDIHKLEKIDNFFLGSIFSVSLQRIFGLLCGLTSMFMAIFGFGQSRFFHSIWLLRTVKSNDSCRHPFAWMKRRTLVWQTTSVMT